ncbi:hypothetical protein [Terricaulis sp.]|uniref:hypothetical protein n=1 Tax=Terricaulis sp. TaxID=2768686 RepID=UPI003782D35B
MRALLASIAAVLLASCASPGPHVQNASLAREIADDAASFNEAYGQAVSGQILLNILRSRDRLPRYYLSMSGITDNPSLRYQESAGIGSIPLGDIGSPWGFGSASVTRETQTRPLYSVQPFTADTLTRAAFEPTEPHVFAHYWNSGWPRDILMLVMVERIEKIDADDSRVVFVNEANTIFEDCPARIETEGCAFVREMRDFLATTAERPPEPGVDMEHGRPLCGLIEARAPATPVRPVAPGANEVCDPVFAIGSTLVRLRLRSLDDMIYYVGELMRAGAMNPGGDGVIEAQVTVRAAGLRGGGRGVPLFRLLPQQAAAPHAIYAAQVRYGEDRYVAGPAIGRSCAEATEDGPCRDDAEHGDRTSSVLSLIAEVLALNQSPDAIRAPNRLITD